MPNSPLSLIIDDQSIDVSYEPSQWTVSHTSARLKGTLLETKDVEGELLDRFLHVSFNGTSISLYGDTPSNSIFRYFSVTIDGGESLNSTYPDGLAAYQQWYQSPSLTEGIHDIALGPLADTSLDFVVISVGRDTPLYGQQLIVDDFDDSYVKYEGGWFTDTTWIDPRTLPAGPPYGGSTHRTETSGDAATFRFTGTSVTVYGVFDWGTVGSLSASYIIDNSTLIVKTYNVTLDSPEYQLGYGSFPNYPYLVLDSLAPGDHSLVINVTSCTNLSLILDYFIYTPSFTSLATMPDLNAPDCGTLSDKNGKGISAMNAKIVLIAIAAIMGLFFLAFAAKEVRKKYSKLRCTLPIDSSNQMVFPDARTVHVSDCQFINVGGSYFRYTSPNTTMA
ncbi:hypothetical protein B0H34DRAFT_208577 [Crassisporium funariophilum]|nr:hypothetical protein B0H34DRAFT_208577 [Crassisporium funariophilum]